MNRLKTFWLIVCLFAGLSLLFPLIAPSQANTVPANFYVAKNGQDKWSGRLATPNTLRTDGPFATLAHARDAVRSLRISRSASSGAKAPIRVLLRGGTYFIEEPFVFTPDDSGMADAPITYAAYPGEKPILSGGLAIKGWKPTTVGRTNLWIADFPSGLPLSSRQLFVNGKRCVRPRLPKEGFYRIAEVPDLTADTAKTRVALILDKSSEI